MSEVPDRIEPYDAVPYEGRPVPLSHPDHLALHALRAGLDAAPPSRCRVLEIACAEGANLLPMAFHLPDSRFVGVDGAATQIGAGLEARDRLGVENLELRHARIEDLDPDQLGEFDYIIAHGVLSWVPPAVRDSLMAIAGRCLAPNGVAFVSFNCAPGWSIRNEMRRALIANAEGDDEPARRIRELLSLFATSPVREMPYSAILADEAQRALAHRDAYLLHEYLEPDNHAFGFGEITGLASAHGLVHLAELGSATADPRIERGLLAGLFDAVGDRVRAEELVELMLFRSFRLSTFRRADATVAPPGLALAEQLTFAAAIHASDPRVSFDAGVAETFVTERGVEVSASSAPLKAALVALGRAYPNGLRLGPLVEAVSLLLESRRLGSLLPLTEDDLRALRADLLELGALGYVRLRLREVSLTADVERPRVNALTRVEAERTGVVSNPYHEVIELDALSRQLVSQLDGTRSLDALVTFASQRVETGVVVLRDGDGEPLPVDTIDAVLPELVRRAVERLARGGILAG